MLNISNIRKHAGDEDGTFPPSKRTEEAHDHEFVPNTLSNDSSDATISDKKVKACAVATVKRVIKIRRKCSSHQTLPANTTSIPSEKVNALNYT